MNAVLKHAQSVIAPYQDPAKGAPDPSFVLQLPDEVYSSSNLYAIQKSFDGEFQFDVFFESGSAKHKLSCRFLTDSSTRFRLESCFSISPRHWSRCVQRQVLEKVQREIPCARRSI